MVRVCCVYAIPSAIGLDTTSPIIPVFICVFFGVLFFFIFCCTIRMAIAAGPRATDTEKKLPAGSNWPTLPIRMAAAVARFLEYPRSFMSFGIACSMARLVERSVMMILCGML